MAENKKDLTIIEEVEELIFDIRNKTYLTGQAREAEGKKPYQAASTMQVSDEDENSYQIRRSLTNAFSTLKSLLSEWLQEDRTMSDNRVVAEIDNDGQLILVFKMPLNYNVASVDSLGDGIHSYLVNTAIAEWFTITNKEDAEAYVAHSAISLENIKRALYKRIRPKRPTY